MGSTTHLSPCYWALITCLVVMGEVTPLAHQSESSPGTTETLDQTVFMSYKDYGSSSDSERPLAMYTPSLSTDTIDVYPNVGTDVNNEIQSWKWVIEWSWVDISKMICSFVGILGNLLVILVLRVQVKITSGSTDILIEALAAADLLTSVFNMPLPVLYYLPNTPLASLYCKLVYTRYFSWVCVHASIYILIGITIERTIAIVSPLYFKYALTARRVYAYITMVWILSFVSCLYPITMRVFNHKCDFLIRSPGQLMVTPVYLVSVRFIIPMTTMVVTQIVTAVSLTRQARRTRHVRAQKDASTHSFHTRARTRLTVLTFFIVLTYIITFAPLHISLMFFLITGKLYSYLFGPMYHVLSLIAFLNSCANPFIYAAQYRKFRAGIRGLFARGRKGNLATPIFTTECVSSLETESMVNHKIATVMTLQSEKA